MAGEPGNLLDVYPLCLWREVTDPHILDHAATKRGHWQLLCEMNSATWHRRIVSRLSCQARDRESSAMAPVKSEKVVSITRLPRSGLVQNRLSRINSVDDSGPAGRDAVASGCDEPEPIPRQFAPLGGVDLDRTHRKLRPAALLQAVIVADTNVRS
jgi:hypothetical protein